MIRGIERRNKFRDNQDKDTFIEYLGSTEIGELAYKTTYDGGHLSLAGSEKRW
jgi:hypothetical protein